MSLKTSTLLLGGGTLLSVAAVGAALVSQHVFGMEPCPWCVLQRVILLAIALACLLGLALRSGIGRQLGAAVGLVLALCGMASALWQHFVAAASNSCDLTLAAKIVGAMQLDSWLPDVFSARASCMDAAVKLAGLSYEFYSLALFVVIAIGCAWVLRQPQA